MIPPRLYIAVDTADRAHAERLAAAVHGYAGLKLGSEFFTAHGPEGVRAVAGDAPVFLDLKFHDIPNTVAGAVRAAAPMQPCWLTVHASGGREMMAAAVQAAHRGEPPVGVLAVTVLTSLDDGDLSRLGQATPSLDQVRRLAALAAEAGVDGLVCSPREIEVVRAEVGPDLTLVVPGIRPAGSDAGDQKRAATPADAVAAGADILVVGRPVTRAADPGAAARAIAAEAG
ncbi:orotidine-5'-phosphate decarboxylase [Limimonas halophila]|uniref:Orotidine 5'-phosphate decarboxylase n=1 Tax=Limimonas halophila TaxID=1082479 RepID=A0A1G7T5V9_9PROT|nr:orotidine-5'-phosphate decarboxylase [Limimonas halophila]SDG30703.1 orotidine-5'-phosphate decarboxylase [Limimonas halophila]